jgi:hypothetical protein
MVLTINFYNVKPFSFYISGLDHVTVFSLKTKKAAADGEHCVDDRVVFGGALGQNT